MESFFALLQKNVLNRHRRTSREQLRLAIVHWIEGIYHRKRRQRGREVDAHRVRSNHQPTGSTRGLNQRVNQTSSSPSGAFDMFELSRLMGHASVAITDKVYAHLRKKDYAAQRARFAPFVTGPAHRPPTSGRANRWPARRSRPRSPALHGAAHRRDDRAD